MFFPIKTNNNSKSCLSWGEFKGESNKGWPNFKMWACPSCDTILGFSEWFSRRN